jgi:formate/nitrite transporter
MTHLFSSPQQTLRSLVEISVKKVSTKPLPLAVLGILAGVYIGFGAHLATTVATESTQFLGYGLTKAISGAVFSVGLMLVVIAGAELFTGNALIPVGMLQKKITLRQLLKNWGIVFLANLVGSLLLVGLIFYSGVNGSPERLTNVGETAVHIATAKVQLTFMQILVRGILANWLVCLAVLLALSSQDITSKIFSCFFPIMAFVAMGFEHSIANMYFLPAGLILTQGSITQLSISSVLINLLAATIGNIIGGSFFEVGLTPSKCVKPQPRLLPLFVQI